ncbi:uncharacterized protein [Branchiostoma lanceolatum]|uniref:uncharacterized protein n=1 Tax=Branchiostoma lanceolatum TaxID=7740 RepID=UPI0034519D30
MEEGADPPTDEEIDQMQLGKLKWILKAFGTSEDATNEMGKEQAKEELKKRIRDIQTTTATATTTTTTTTPITAPPTTPTAVEAATAVAMSILGRQQSITEAPQQSSTPDKDTFTQTKSMAQGFMDMALLVANAGQLKLVLNEGRHGRIFLYEFVLFLLVSSIVVQITVGILLYLKTRYTADNPEHRKKLDLVNSVATGLVMIITVLNVFISAFVMVDQRPFTASAQAPATVAGQPALPTVGPVIDVPGSTPTMTTAQVPTTT